MTKFVLRFMTVGLTAALLLLAGLGMLAALELLDQTDRNESNVRSVLSMMFE